MTIYLGKEPSKVDIERDDIVRSLEIAKDIFDEAEELQDLVSGITDLMQDLNAIKGCLQIKSTDAIKDVNAAIGALKWLIVAEEPDFEDCLARGECDLDMHPFVMASRALGLEVNPITEGGEADEVMG